MPSTLATAKAIARALRAARREARTPETIVLSLMLYEQLRAAPLSYLWGPPRRDTLFGLPVVVDPEVTGWRLRTRHEPARCPDVAPRRASSKTSTQKASAMIVATTAAPNTVPSIRLPP